MALKQMTTEELLSDLAARLDADPDVHWHRAHDSLHDLYLASRPYVQMKAAMAEAISDWPQTVSDSGLVLDSIERRYHPKARDVEILRYVDDPDRLYEYAKGVLNAPIDEFEKGSSGWDRIIDQASVELSWEWVLVDPAAPWASMFTNAERQRVVIAGRAS